MHAASAVVPAMEGFLRSLGPDAHGLAFLDGEALPAALEAAHRAAGGLDAQLVLGGVPEVAWPAARGIWALPEATPATFVQALAKVGRDALDTGRGGALVVVHVAPFLEAFGSEAVASTEAAVGRRAPPGVRLACLYTEEAAARLSDEVFDGVVMSHPPGNLAPRVRATERV
jgi:hypothetical protein